MSNEHELALIEKAFDVGRELKAGVRLWRDGDALHIVLGNVTMESLGWMRDRPPRARASVACLFCTGELTDADLARGLLTCSLESSLRSCETIHTLTLVGDQVVAKVGSR